MAPTGGIATLLINPVCKPPNTSAIDSGIGTISNAASARAEPGSLSGTQTLCACTSSTLESTFLDMAYANPTSAIPNETKPLLSKPCINTISILSRT